MTAASDHQAASNEEILAAIINVVTQYMPTEELQGFDALLREHVALISSQTTSLHRRAAVLESRVNYVLELQGLKKPLPDDGAEKLHATLLQQLPVTFTETMVEQIAEAVCTYVFMTVPLASRSHYYEEHLSACYERIKKLTGSVAGQKSDDIAMRLIFEFGALTQRHWMTHNVTAEHCQQLKAKLYQILASE